MVLPHYEEWRLSFVLPPGDVKTGVLMERLRERLPGEVDAHRKGRRGIRLFTQSNCGVFIAGRLTMVTRTPLPSCISSQRSDSVKP